jgi:hypothetical protein
MKFSQVEILQRKSSLNTSEIKKQKAIIRSMKTKLGGKGYQKSANRPQYYARMVDGLVPYKTGEEARAASHGEARQILEAAELKLDELIN